MNELFVKDSHSSKMQLENSTSGKTMEQLSMHQFILDNSQNVENALSSIKQKKRKIILPKNLQNGENHSALAQENKSDDQTQLQPLIQEQSPQMKPPPYQQMIQPPKNEQENLRNQQNPPLKKSLPENAEQPKKNPLKPTITPEQIENYIIDKYTVMIPSNTIDIIHQLLESHRERNYFIAKNSVAK
jgi:hypothetical protein